MSITQQYILDSYRSSQHGDAPPPAPGSHDWETAREVRENRRFRAVMAGRPARGRLRGALGRWLHGGHGRPAR
ncbi:hypothetical protein ACFXAW_21410 [Streptomyces sp. NPDC059445]|uniref:hypothetical protein n=1 Tax=unclassified Streptomyces TaxID=2593676 RepID=UPI00369CE946